MRFGEVVFGGFKLYSATHPAPDGRGYVATLLIKQDLPSGIGETEVFNDEAFTEAMPSASEDDALQCAFRLGKALVSAEPWKPKASPLVLLED